MTPGPGLLVRPSADFAAQALVSSTQQVRPGDKILVCTPWGGRRTCGAAATATAGSSGPSGQSAASRWKTAAAARCGTCRRTSSCPSTRAPDLPREGHGVRAAQGGDGRRGQQLQRGGGAGAHPGAQAVGLQARPPGGQRRLRRISLLRQIHTLEQLLHHLQCGGVSAPFSTGGHLLHDRRHYPTGGARRPPFQSVVCDAPHNGGKVRGLHVTPSDPFGSLRLRAA